MRIKISFPVLVFCLFFCFGVCLAQNRTITVVSEPNSIVWLNDIRYGTTDKDGRLTIKNLSGAKRLRVRAGGFKETTQNLLATQKGDVKVALVKTTDEAELAFQEAESLVFSDREKSAAAYRKAISLRPKYAEAQVGLARVLNNSGDTEGALKAVKAAKISRPGFAEATAVEALIYKADNEEEKAVATFKRALTEGKGFQPEAHTGLGLIYKERAEAVAAGGDFESEKENYNLAAVEFKKAIQQLGGAPDAITLYQLLGEVYEKSKRFNEAIQVYEEFLRIFPDTSEATAVRSFIIQIKKQMSEQE